MSTFIVAVNVDSLSTDMFGGAQFSASAPPNSKMVTTQVPSMGQIRHTSYSRTLGGFFPHFFREQN